MGEFIEFEVNQREFEKRIKEIGKKVEDLRIPFGVIARSHLKFQRTIFQSKKGPGKYKDLTAGTKLAKTRAGFSVYPILVQTGELAKANLQPGGFNITNIGKQTLELGVKSGPGGIVYAATHQFGDRGRNIPERRYLFIDDQRIRVWLNILESHLAKVVN